MIPELNMRKLPFYEKKRFWIIAGGIFWGSMMLIWLIEPKSAPQSPASESSSTKKIDPDKEKAIRDMVVTKEEIRNAFSSFTETEYADFIDKDIVPKRLQYSDADINKVFLKTLRARKEEAKKIHERKLQLKEQQKELGPRPENSSWDASVDCVKEYLQETLDDPSSVEYVGWSAVYIENINGMKSWAVRVKYRAKNSFGAYILQDQVALIRDNKVQLMIAN